MTRHPTRHLPPTSAERTALDDREFAWRYLRLLGATPDVADDLAQEVLMRLLQVAWDAPTQRTAQGSTSDCIGRRRAWIQRTARHLWLQRIHWLRRRRERAWVDGVDEAMAQRWSDGGDRFVEALGHCMERLTDRARTAVSLRHQERWNRARIGTELGLKPGGVKILLERSRRFLRECINKEMKL